MYTGNPCRFCSRQRVMDEDGKHVCEKCRRDQATGEFVPEADPLDELTAPPASKPERAESYMERVERETLAKLEAYIASDPTDMELPSFWDILGIPNGTYSQAVDEHIIYVIERMIPNPLAAFTTEIAQEKGWPDEYVELIKYILCSADLAEYGTSPRGAWIHFWLADIMPRVIARWRKDWDDTEAEGNTSA